MRMFWPTAVNIIIFFDKTWKYIFSYAKLYYCHQLQKSFNDAKTQLFQVKERKINVGEMELMEFSSQTSIIVSKFCSLEIMNNRTSRVCVMHALNNICFVILNKFWKE